MERKSKKRDGNELPKDQTQEAKRRNIGIEDKAQPNEKSQETKEELLAKLFAKVQQDKMKQASQETEAPSENIVGHPKQELLEPQSTSNLGDSNAPSASKDISTSQTPEQAHQRQLKELQRKEEDRKFKAYYDKYHKNKFSKEGIREVHLSFKSFQSELPLVGIGLSGSGFSKETNKFFDYVKKYEIPIGEAAEAFRALELANNLNQELAKETEAKT